MPPASCSRSTTSTRPAPRGASSVATASPPGPAPTTSTSTSRSRRPSGTLAPLETPGELADGGAAVETLAAAIGGAGASAQSVEVPRGHRRRLRVADLPERHALAVAHDLPVGRVRRHEVGALVRALLRLAERRHRGSDGAVARRRPEPPSARSPTARSAIAIDAVRPVERIPPTHTYPCSGCPR